MLIAEHLEAAHGPVCPGGKEEDFVLCLASFLSPESRVPELLQCLSASFLLAESPPTQLSAFSRKTLA